jgi:hypothetical protein
MDTGLMGIVHRGIHPKIALRLKRRYRLNHFVETGTFLGRSAHWASDHFDYVFTLEAHQRYFDRANDLLEGRLNVVSFLGSSPTGLRNIIDIYVSRVPVLFWLDAHWSRDLDWKASESELPVCPVLDEIRAINELMPGRHAIMIDDARLFDVTNGWPSISEVGKVFRESPIHTRSWIEDDVIVAVRGG